MTINFNLFGKYEGFVDAGKFSSCLTSKLIFIEKNRSKSEFQDWALISAYQPTSPIKSQI
jgi:hypothetical protein